MACIAIQNRIDDDPVGRAAKVFYASKGSAQDSILSSRKQSEMLTYIRSFLIGRLGRIAVHEEAYHEFALF